MNLATEQFKLPWESGEPIIKRVTEFSFKASFDKLYVMSVDDYLARGEVIHNAIKNSYFMKTRQSRNMDFMATSINLEYDTNIPECFGTFLGKFIPAAGHVGGIPWNEFTPEELKNQSDHWVDQFFEHYCEFWCLILVNTQHPHTKIREIGNKPVWVKLSRSHMAYLWQPRYKDLLTKGLRTTPGYEQVINPQPYLPSEGVDISTLFPQPVKP